MIRQALLSSIFIGMIAGGLASGQDGASAPPLDLRSPTVADDLLGKVYDSVNGGIVPGATLRLLREGYSVRETTSDSGGNYLFDVYPANGSLCIVEASKAGYGGTLDSVYPVGYQTYHNLYLAGQLTTGSMSGRVTSADDGSPLEGAQIRFIAPAWIAYTNANGEYSFPSVATGTYQVQVIGAGHINSLVMVTITAGVNTVHDFELTSLNLPNMLASPPTLTFEATQGEPSPASQSFTVTSSGERMDLYLNQPAPYWLTASMEADSTPGVVTVSVNTYNLNSGTHQATITVYGSPSEGPLEYPVTCVVSESAGDSTGQVGGIVWDEQWQGINGATVSMIRAGVTVAQTITNGGGYSFENVVPGLYSMRAEHSGYYSEVKEGLSISVGAALMVDFHLAEIASGTGSVTGTVTDSVTGLPIEGVSITDDGMAVHYGATDSNGEYSFSFEPGTLLPFFAWRTGYADRFDIPGGTVVSGQELVIDFSMQPEAESMGTVKGIVTDSVTGLPITGVVIHDGGGMLIYDQTDANGEYSFTREPGVMPTFAAHHYHERYYDRFDIPGGTVVAGQELVRNFSMQPVAVLGNLSGRVTSAATGLAIKMATVTLTGDSTTFTSGTDPNGDYLFENIAPGTYSMDVSHWDFYDAMIESILVVAGSTAVANVEMTPIGRGDVAGFIYDAATGLPIAGASARAMQARHMEDSTVTDAEGAYQIAGLAEGAFYWMQGWAEGYAPYPLDDEHAEFFWVVDDQVETVNIWLRKLRTWHVAMSGSNVTGDGSEEHPFATVQFAVDTSYHGDTVLVHHGTYTGGVVFRGKGILLTSEFGLDGNTAHTDSTFLLGGRDADTLEAVSFIHHEDSTSIVQGFTIMHDSTRAPALRNGSGIVCYLASPIIRNNRIAHNQRGIHCKYDASPLILSNLIELNAGTNRGAGIYCQDSSLPEIRGNMIMKNTSTSWGGGLACFQFSHAYVVDNVFDSNTAVEGGAMSLTWFSDGLVDSNIVTGNSAKRGGGIYCDRESDFHITNNQIRGNSALGEGAEGGGLCISGSSEPHVIHNRIEGNYSEWRGGGIACYQTRWPTIDTNVVVSNSAYEGGGMYIGNLVWTHVRDNVIESNSAVSSGGGVFCWATEAQFMRNLFANNSSDSLGGAVAVKETNSLPLEIRVTFLSCTFYGNGAPEGSAFGLLFEGHVDVQRSIVAFGSGGPVVNCREHASISFECTDIFGNAGGDWTDCHADQLSISDNFSIDPLFCNASGGNYMVSSSSRCVENHPETSCADRVGLYGPGCFPVEEVPVGSGVVVQIDEWITLQFDSVDVPGTVELELSPIGPPPVNFQILPAKAPLYYNITTDAVFEGQVEVCVQYSDDDVSYDDAAGLTLRHFDGATWVDITQSADPISNTVCGLTSSFSPFVLAPRPVTGIEDGGAAGLPVSFGLAQNYPNPFNPVTNINYSLPVASDVKIEVFNIAGQRVVVFEKGGMPAGYHTVIWDAGDVASGVYLYRLTAGDFIETKKMVLLK